MRTIAIKIKNYTEWMDVVNSHNAPHVLKALLGSLGILAIMYLFLLGSMVFNIIERKSLEAEAHTLSTEVGALELDYMAMSNKIDLPYSESLGFKQTKATFATRKALGSLPSIKMKNEI